MMMNLNRKGTNISFEPQRHRDTEGKSINRRGAKGAENKTLLLLVLFVLILAVSACSGGGGDPTQVVRDYLQAKIEADREGIAAVLCSSLEANLDNETRTFETVTGAELVDVECTFDEETNVVSCDGSIMATYGTEDTEFPLTNYRVVQEDGEWKWCGEAG